MEKHNNHLSVDLANPHNDLRQQLFELDVINLYKVIEAAQACIDIRLTHVEEEASKMSLETLKDIKNDVAYAYQLDLTYQCLDLPVMYFFDKNKWLKLRPSLKHTFDILQEIHEQWGDDVFLSDEV